MKDPRAGSRSNFGICLATELDWFADRTKWAGLRTVGMVEATREVGGKTAVERRYYLSTLALGVETFARAVRRRTWPPCGTGR